MVVCFMRLTPGVAEVPPDRCATVSKRDEGSRIARFWKVGSSNRAIRRGRGCDGQAAAAASRVRVVGTVARV